MKFDYKNLSVEKCKDSGLALVLICLICFQVWKLPILILLAIMFLIVAMTYPPIFKPFAIFWFALSTALGTVISKIILSVLFFVIVLPIGLLRRAMGKDAMQIKSWKKSNVSVFRVKNHRYEAKDLEHPY
ncbi:SxtJ family membrane protein [Thermodesulfobacteriota bacterium]